MLPPPAMTLAAAGLTLSASTLIVVALARRKRDVAKERLSPAHGACDSRAIHDGCPAATAAVAACRSLTRQLAERDEILRQVRTGAVEEHRVLLESISDRERELERLRQLAHFDDLTGLPNRWLFLERLARAINDARANGFELGVMSVHIDGLRKVNSSLSHVVGDKLLQEVASRMEQSLRHHDAVGRWAGSEFMLILPRLSRAADAETVARKLLQAVAEPFEIEGYVLNVTATIGISMFPADGIEGESLVQHATSAQHRARREGTHRFETYTSASVSAIASPFIENGLRRAIERAEFALHYQPIIRLDTGRVTGAEALLRWEHPQLGTLPPACFITLAEELGVIASLTTWVLREACAQIVRWDARDLRIGRVAVNISAHQLRDENFSEVLSSIVDEAGVDPARIELEVTETVFVSDDRRSVDTLEILQKRGFRIAIDDFGTGYSSLGYLQRLPIDRLKIDRTFVRDLDGSEESAAIAELIISVARRLGLRVTAEGVETKDQLELLRELGCDEMQGFFLGMPGPAATIEDAMCALDVETEREIGCTTTS
jgi:diguanylate cyclase (GGDEF)-like protein